MSVVAQLNGQPVKVDRVQRDGMGQWYLGYVESGFFPTMVLVRGESFQDAYDWLLTHPSIVKQIEVDPTDTYFASDYGDLQEATESGRLTYTDDGVLVDAESVMLHGPTRVDFFAAQDAA